MFAIALGDLVEELKGKVIEMEKARKYEVTVKRSKYPVVLHADIEDGGYWVECRTLPGCASQGDTIEEALEMIKDAIEGHLEITAEDEGGAGWTVRGQRGSHVKLTREGNPNILSIPAHKGKPVKQGLLRDQLEKAGLTMRNS